MDDAGFDSAVRKFGTELRSRRHTVALLIGPTLMDYSSPLSVIDIEARKKAQPR